MDSSLYVMTSNHLFLSPISSIVHHSFSQIKDFVIKYECYEELEQV